MDLSLIAIKDYNLLLRHNLLGHNQYQQRNFDFMVSFIAFDSELMNLLDYY